MNSIVPFVSSSPPPYDENLEEEFNDFRSANFPPFNIDNSPSKDYLQKIDVENDNISCKNDLIEQLNGVLKNELSVEYQNSNIDKSKIDDSIELSNNVIFPKLETNQAINTLNIDNNNSSTLNDNISPNKIPSISNLSETIESLTVNNDSSNNTFTNNEFTYDEIVDVNTYNTDSIDDTTYKHNYDDKILTNDNVLLKNNVYDSYVNEFSENLICDNINSISNKDTNYDLKDMHIPKNVFNQSNEILKLDILVEAKLDLKDDYRENVSVHIDKLTYCSDEDDDQWTNFDSEPIIDDINQSNLPIINSCKLNIPENSVQEDVIDNIRNLNLRTNDDFVNHIEIIKNIKDENTSEILNNINNFSINKNINDDDLKTTYIIVKTTLEHDDMETNNSKIENVYKNQTNNERCDKYDLEIIKQINEDGKDIFKTESIASQIDSGDYLDDDDWSDFHSEIKIIDKDIHKILSLTNDKLESKSQHIDFINKHGNINDDDDWTEFDSEQKPANFINGLKMNLSNDANLSDTINQNLSKYNDNWAEFEMSASDNSIDFSMKNEVLASDNLSSYEILNICFQNIPSNLKGYTYSLDNILINDSGNFINKPQISQNENFKIMPNYKDGNSINPEISEDILGNSLFNFEISKQREEKSSHLWNRIKNIEETPALTMKWISSCIRLNYLRSINIDANNIISLSKKTSLPAFALNLGLLEPKIIDNSISKNDAECEKSPKIDTQSVHFDWKCSGLKNPLDVSKAEFEMLESLGGNQAMTNINSISVQSNLPPITLLQPANVNGKKFDILDTFTNTSKQPIAHRVLSPEAESILADLPDLSFMTSKVLMFPMWQHQQPSVTE